MELAYRLIALDVDGTLLNEEHVLTEGTKDAVRRASQAGAEIVLCTGRGFSEAFHLLEEMGLSGMLIAHNGATTVRSEDRTLVHGFSYPMEQARVVIDYCRNHGLHYNVNSVFELYADEISDEVQAMYDTYGIRPTKVPDVYGIDQPIFKMTAFGTPEEMDRLSAEWEKLGSGLNPIRSEPRFIDIMHPDATKGNALKQLAERQRVPQEKVLAIGNYYNDIDMLRYAGLGVAMGNAPDAVKEAADLVTLANSEEGVRAVLLRHVL